MIEKNEEQEVEEIVEPIVEAIEIIEPVIKPIVEVLELESGAELMEQAKGKQWRMVLAEQDLVVPEEYQTTEEILQYLEFISANYLVVNNLPQLAKDASIS